jgi:hypothetical protein
MPPRPTELKETWGEWWEGWKLWFQQVGMNVWYGRGGLNVKVGEFDCFVNNFVEVVQLPKEFSCLPRLPGLIELRFATISGPSGGKFAWILWSGRCRQVACDSQMIPGTEWESVSNIWHSYIGSSYAEKLHTPNYTSMSMFSCYQRAVYRYSFLSNRILIEMLQANVNFTNPTTYLAVLHLEAKTSRSTIWNLSVSS